MNLPGNWIPFFSQVQQKVLGQEDSSKPSSLCGLGSITRTRRDLLGDCSNKAKV